VYGDAPLPPAGSDVCALEDVPLDGAIVVAFGAALRAPEIIVVRDAAGVRGFVNVCPHWSLPLNIDRRIYAHDGHVHCDHHYAIFRFTDGRCTDGVCEGDGLEPAPLAVRDGRVVLAATDSGGGAQVPQQ